MLALKRFLNLRRGRIDARKEVRKQLRIRSRLESDIFKKINTLFRTQLKKTSNQYQITTRFDPEIFSRETSALMETVMNQHYKKIFRIVFRDNEEIYDRGRKDEELFVFGRAKDFERIVNEYFRTRIPYFSGMSTVMSRAIQKQIERGRLENLSLAQIVRNIDDLTKVGRSRAALIARTETHNAASYANHQYHKTASEEYGIEMVKRWVSTSDLRTRSAHNLANGQTVPMDEKFTVGGAKMDYAGDPAGGAKNVVNCRCVIIYVEPEDEENIIEDQTVIDKNDFGDTEPSELEYHLKSNWDGEDRIRDIIRKTPALKNGVITGKFNNSYYTPYKHQIHMKIYKQGDEYAQSVWRHEYGHFIDNSPNFLETIKASPLAARYKLGDGGIKEVTRITGNVSTLAAKSLAQDKKVLAAMNRKNKKNWEKYKESSVYYKKDVTELFGFNFVQGEGYLLASSTDDLAIKIRTFLNDTDGFVNTKFLDDLLGEDWAKKIIHKNIKGNAINDVWYVNDLLDTLTQIKTNYSVKRYDFVAQVYKLAMLTDNKAIAGEIIMFRDLIGSVTNNLYLNGHTNLYYARGYTIFENVHDDHTGEAFANYISLLGGRNASFWRRLLNDLVPNTLQDFDDIISFLNTNT